MCGWIRWGGTYFVGVARVRLRVMGSALLGVGRDWLLGLLGAIRDAGRAKTHCWRRADRVNAWRSCIVRVVNYKMKGK